MALHHMYSQSPEAIKGLSSMGAGMTSVGSTWIFSHKQGSEHRLLQGSVSLELPVKSAALKIAQRSAQNYWSSRVPGFESQSSLMSLFDYII